MLNLSKQAIRKTCVEQRKAQPVAQQQQFSKMISEHVYSLSQYQNAKHIVLYHAIQGEVDLTMLWKKNQLEQKQSYFPVVKDYSLLFLPSDSQTRYIKNSFGILEPMVAHSKAIAIEKIDILILPLIAFDSIGNRIGTGGGYYDRTLSEKRPKLLMGVAYEFQHQPSVPSDPWDISLDVIITEQAVYWSKK